LNDGTATFENATVAYNKDGGIENKGTLNLTNTIVAENSGEGDCVGKATTSDHSLDSNGSCNVGRPQQQEPAAAETAAQRRRSTPVHSLKPTSPAIGAGDSATCTTTDQRGATRAKPCSVGADEYSSTPPTIKVPSAEIVRIAGFGVTATGVNSAIREIVCTPEEPGAFIVVGDYKEKCTAIDGHENKASGEFELDVTKMTTAPPAPTVVTGTATTVTQATATLNATVNPNGANVSACEFEYGTTTSYGKTVACSTSPGAGTSAVSVSAPLSGLSPNTTYDYRISATNSTGTSTGSNETLKTLEELKIVPAPTVVTGTATTVTQATATLNATVNPNGANVSACEFEYGTTTSYGKTVACSTSPGAGTSAVSVSAPLSGLSPNTTYDYRISATNSTGTSKGLNETLKTPAEVVVIPAPTVVTGTATTVTQTTATLNATVNPNGANVTACEFEYGTTTSYGKTVACSTSPGAGTSAVSVSAPLSGLSPNTTYDYRISATNSTGTSKGLNETLKTPAEVVVIPAPTVVTGTATTVTQTTATLNATVNPNGANVTACEFEYGTTTSYGKTVACSTSPGAGTSAVSVSAPLSGLSPNTTYDYRISATNSTGTSKGLNETLKTPAEVVVIPAPTVVTGTATTVTQTTATLNATVNPNGANVTACEFEYGTTTSYGKTVACSTSPGAGTSAVSVSAPLSGLSPNTTYDYRISATNSTGTSKGLNETLKTPAEVVVIPAPTVVTGTATTVTQTTATLNATVNPNGANVTACEFEYGTTTSYGKTVACSTSPGAGTSAVSVSAPLSGLSAEHHLRLQDLGDQLDRHEQRLERNLQNACRSGRHTGPDGRDRHGHHGHADDGHPERHRQPQRRQRDGLRVRIRHHDQLRQNRGLLDLAGGGNLSRVGVGPAQRPERRTPPTTTGSRRPTRPARAKA
jgi:phosphodiesterase/alkaline phosphatase D-like protein